MEKKYNEPKAEVIVIREDIISTSEEIPGGGGSGQIGS